MILSGLALESEAGRPGGLTITLGPGYNLLHADEALALRLAGLLAAGIYPDSPPCFSFGPGTKLRLTFQSRLGGLSMVERDLGLDTSVLSKAESTDGPYEPVGGNPAEIGQRLRTEERLPPLKAFMQIYMGLEASDTGNAGTSEVAEEDLHNAVVPAREVASMHSSLDLPGISPVQRLLELRKELRAAQRAEDIEYELEGIRQELFRLEDRHRKYVENQQKLIELENRLEELPEIDENYLDIEVKLDKLAAKKKQLTTELARLEEDYTRRSEGTRARSLTDGLKDPLALMGLALGLLLLLLAAVIGGGAKFLALGTIASFGVTTFSLVKFMDEEKERETEARRLKVVKERHRKVQELLAELDAEEARLTSSHDGLDPVERRRVLEERKKVEAAYKDLQARLATVQNSQVFRHFEDRRVELKRKQEDLEEELGRMGALSSTPGAIRQEVAMLEERLGLRPGQPIPPGMEHEIEESAGLVGLTDHSSEPSVTITSVTCSRDLAETFRLLFERAAEDMFFKQPEEVANMVSKRLGQVLAAFTDGRARGIRFGPAGRLAAISTGRGEVPRKKADAVLLKAAVCAARYSLVEAGRDKFEAPAFFGPELDDTGDLETIVEALKILGQKVQVVHASAVMKP